MTKRKLINVLSSLIALVMAVIPATTASAWDAWGVIPVQWGALGRVSTTDTKLPFDYDSAYKPWRANKNQTQNSIDVEWDFFYGTFAGGYGACTSATAGAYTCPGGITVQVNQPSGDAVVASVSLVDRTDWSVWNVTQMPVSGLRAAALAVNWTSAAGSNFEDTITEVHFPANSINLPSAAEQQLLQTTSLGGAMWHGAAAFQTNRNGWNQFTGGSIYFAAPTPTPTPTPTQGATESLAATGANAWREVGIAGGLVMVGMGLHIASRMRRPAKRK